MSKAVIISILGILVLGTLGWFGFTVYSNFYGAPNGSPTGEYVFEVKKDEKLSDITKKLETDKVINSSSSILLLEKLDPIKTLQTGKYTLNLNKNTPQEILKLIDTETREITEEKAKNVVPTVTITFKEGETIDDIIAKLLKNNLSTEEELKSYLNKIDNFDPSEYEFLPKPLECEYGNIKTCAKYYIEGYLYPDTYNFFINSKPKDIFAKFLDNFETKVWLKLKSQIGGKDFGKAMILASVLEKETGRTKGVTAETKDDLSKERQAMAQVFYNRVANKMSWQSDVTAEYATGKKLCQQTFKVPNCMFLDSQDAQTKYNTYIIESYPIGPVTNPQFDNISAAINPTDNDYLFFVSDVTGKKYFAKTGNEHLKVIQQVNEINRKLGL